MEEEQQKEWVQLQNSVINILRKGCGEIKAGQRVFQLLVIPSFDPAVSIEAFLLPNDTSGFLFSRMLWEKNTDCEKLNNPVDRLRHPYPLLPTIKVQTVILDDGFLERVIQMLASIHIPVWVNPQTLGFGIDGTTYELRLGVPFSEARYCWWERPPVQWKPLEEIVSTIQEYAADVKF